MPERDREDGAVAVDHVEPEQDRDLEPRLLDGDLLQRVEALGVVDPEHGAGALAQRLLGPGSAAEGDRRPPA